MDDMKEQSVSLKGMSPVPPIHCCVFSSSLEAQWRSYCFLPGGDTISLSPPFLLKTPRPSFQPQDPAQGHLLYAESEPLCQRRILVPRTQQDAPKLPQWWLYFILKRRGEMVPRNV